MRQERAGKLARQTARLQKATTARGDEVAAVISEHALFLNEKRKGMKKLLVLLKEQAVEGVFIADPSVGTLRFWVARRGFELTGRAAGSV